MNLNIIPDSSPYYSDSHFSIYLGDSLELLATIPDKTFDMIFADPPYFLSNDGITCSGGKMVSVNKAEWDSGKKIEDIYTFNLSWIKECQRILKANGTIWISGTYHNIYSVGFALQELDFKLLNNITWYKRNPPPNLSCRYFTHSTETILWASKNNKSKHYFNYKLMKEINRNKQMKDVWEFPIINKKEKVHGQHPTQKPKSVLKRIILSSTQQDDLVLDPFNGSGTTGVVCKELNRRYVGIDMNEKYLELTLKRYDEIKNIIQMDIYGG